MNDRSKIFLGIITIVLVLTIYGCVLSAHERELKKWVVARGEVPKVVESRAFSIGPYWYIKGATYFYVETDKNVYWVKYYIGRTIKREVDGKYETIED